MNTAHADGTWSRCNCDDHAARCVNRSLYRRCPCVCHEADDRLSASEAVQWMFAGAAFIISVAGAVATFTR